LVENIHELAREHAPEVIARLLVLMRQDDDRDIALAAANSLLDRGYGRPPQAILATVNGGLTVSGIDAPPPIINETDEQWLERRRAELAALEHATRREPAPSLAPSNGAASSHTPLHGAPPPSPAEMRPSRQMSDEQERWLDEQRRRLSIGDSVSVHPNPEWERRR
jgi:hypothetical protein